MVKSIEDNSGNIFYNVKMEEIIEVEKNLELFFPKNLKIFI